MSGGWNERFEVRRQWMVGRAPTMSGYSCGGFALSIVDILQELERMGQSAMALQHAIH
jgi:hypothetical protein